MVGRIMGTCLIGCHSAACSAKECMVKEERSYSYFFRVKFIKYIMCVKCPVVVTHTCMVSSHNKMGASVVFSYDCMKYCLLWPCISHGGREYPNYSPVCRVIFFQNYFVTPHSDICCDIITFCLSHQWMKEKTINYLKGALLYIFVCPVNWITGLKTYNPFPALFSE